MTISIAIGALLVQSILLRLLHEAEVKHVINRIEQQAQVWPSCRYNALMLPLRMTMVPFFLYVVYWILDGNDTGRISDAALPYYVIGFTLFLGVLVATEKHPNFRATSPEEAVQKETPWLYFFFGGAALMVIALLIGGRQ